MVCMYLSYRKYINTNTELISISPTHVFVMEPISSVSLFCLSINTHTHTFSYVSEQQMVLHSMDGIYPIS